MANKKETAAPPDVRDIEGLVKALGDSAKMPAKRQNVLILLNLAYAVSEMKADIRRIAASTKQIESRLNDIRLYERT